MTAKKTTTKKTATKKATKKAAPKKAAKTTKKAATTAPTTATNANPNAPITDFTEERLKQEGCVWNISDKCTTELMWLKVFNSQLCIPICSHHKAEHADIMTLYKNGYDVEEILTKTPEWRHGEVMTIKLSGLDNGEVPL
jgi:hypothetical protein